MKADFSRNTFDPAKHYSAVLLQQGRVQVDADWNEQRLIDAHLRERASADLVGNGGVPVASPGFGLAFTPDGSDITISPGRLYAGGMLCEAEADAVATFTSIGDHNATIALPRSDLADYLAGQWVRLAVAGSAAQTLRITGVTLADGSVTLALSAAVALPTPAPAAGASFTGSVQRVASYASQPDYPHPDFTVLPADGSAATLALANGWYVSYLDVWHRTLTALDDPQIRESALGGPDTAVRVKTVWQLKLLAVTPPPGGAPACGTDFPEWDTLVQGTTGGLSARAAPAAGQAGPCLIPPGGGYQGLENQLYRIEIHDAGSDGTATFKWSRDNGSVVMSILAFSGSSLRLADTGPDDALGLANGQWVEILGDVEDLHGLPGQLLQIATVNPATATVTFATPPAVIAAGSHPKLRRWDSAGALPVVAGGTWIDLELGVQVAFDTGTYATADYWLVPARTGAAASVEWPHALPQPARGIEHRHVRLGLVNWAGSAATSLLTDCRLPFAPVTSVPAALHVKGISWPNDDVVQLPQLVAGLQIVLDSAPTATYTLANDPGNALTVLTVTDSTMTVTVEVPVPLPNGSGAMPTPVVLHGNTRWVDSASAVLWTPGNTAQAVLNSLTGGQAQVRVRLRGSAIWSDQGQRRLYLDGETQGVPGLSLSQTQALRSDLAFPSGTGRAASDFESWFTLQFAATPVFLAGFSVGPLLLVNGGNLTAQVTLGSQAQAPVVVTLAASASPGTSVVLPVDASGATTVTVPAGQASVTFLVSVNASATSAITLSASVPPISDPTKPTSLTAPAATVAVLAVSVSPPATSLLANNSIQFTASVSAVGAGGLPGGVSPAVTWSCSGGSIDGSGTYVAPPVAGTYTVTAASVADPGRTASATVTVNTKNKDKDKEFVKEGGKENVKETAFDKASTKEFAAEKVSDSIHNKLTDFVQQPVGAPVVRPASFQAVTPGLVQPAAQRAFITPAERPDVAPPPLPPKP